MTFTSPLVLWIAIGAGVVALAFYVRHLRGRSRASPGDYETELIRLCGAHKAEQLIREEQERSPALSRVGAALALVTRMRVEREGLGPPL